MKLRCRVLTAVLASALAVSMLSGCNLIEVDKVKEGQEVVAKVGDQVITRDDFMEEYQPYATYYGIKLSDDDESNQQLKDEIMDNLVQLKIREMKSHELGLDNLTDADRAEIQKRVQDSIQSNYEQALEYYKTAAETDDTINPEEKAAQERDLYLQAYPEDVRVETETKAFIDERLVDDTCKDISVTDDATKAEYDKQLKEKQENYETLPYQYNTDYLAETEEKPLIYTPGGFNYVQHILIMFDQETRDAITTARQNAVSSASTITDPAENAKAIADSEYTKEADDLRAKGLESVKAKAEEVLGKVKADPAQWDALSEEYNEDTGMKQEPAKSKGYAVNEGSAASGTTAGFAKEFVEGAMSLKNDGDITDLVATDFGYHIIKRIGQSVEKTRSYDEMKTEIHDALLQTARDERMTEKLKEWTEATKITKYMKRLK